MNNLNINVRTLLFVVCLSDCRCQLLLISFQAKNNKKKYYALTFLMRRGNIKSQTQNKTLRGTHPGTCDRMLLFYELFSICLFLICIFCVHLATHTNQADGHRMTTTKQNKKPKKKRSKIHIVMFT